MTALSRRHFLSLTGSAAAAALSRNAIAAMGPNDKFDLLIKGGEVLDPSQSLRGKRDVGIRWGVVEALDAVPAQVRDAASAVGYRPIARIVKVELPLSIPVLVAGLRVVVVTNISMVSVGAVIGIGGLGTWFTEGYQANKSDQIVAGIFAIFVLAAIIDVALMFAGRIATPWVRVTRPGRRLLTAPVVGGSR